MSLWPRLALVVLLLAPAWTAAALEHGPASAGRCTVCHASHEAERQPGLVAPEKTLCFSCHQDLERSLAAGYRHQPVRQGPCTTCHDAHRSPYRGLLKADQQVLCLGCHPEVAKDARRASVHRPVAEGRCTDCHEPHNSPYRKLLKEPLDDHFYGPFAVRRFALCFRCHPAELARLPEGTATGFRRGRASEHYFHVNDPAKGRSCWVCHEPHGADQSHLLRTSAPFGQWALPIVFSPLPDGGACLCGCHKKLEYRRD
jgi:predicted CXXCH cytochrome family protein